MTIVVKLHCLLSLVFYFCEGLVWKTFLSSELYNEDQSANIQYYKKDANTYHVFLTFVSLRFPALNLSSLQIAPSSSENARCKCALVAESLRSEADYRLNQIANVFNHMPCQNKQQFAGSQTTEILLFWLDIMGVFTWIQTKQYLS